MFVMSLFFFLLLGGYDACHSFIMSEKAQHGIVMEIVDHHSQNCIPCQYTADHHMLSLTSYYEHNHNGTYTTQHVHPNLPISRKPARWQTALFNVVSSAFTAKNAKYTTSHMDTDLHQHNESQPIELTLTTTSDTDSKTIQPPYTTNSTPINDNDINDSNILSSSSSSSSFSSASSSFSSRFKNLGRLTLNKLKKSQSTGIEQHSNTLIQTATQQQPPPTTGNKQQQQLKHSHSSDSTNHSSMQMSKDDPTQNHRNSNIDSSIASLSSSGSSISVSSIRANNVVKNVSSFFSKLTTKTYNNLNTIKHHIQTVNANNNKPRQTTNSTASTALRTDRPTISGASAGASDASDAGTTSSSPLIDLSTWVTDPDIHLFHGYVLQPIQQRHQHQLSFSFQSPAVISAPSPTTAGSSTSKHAIAGTTTDNTSMATFGSFTVEQTGSISSTSSDSGNSSTSTFAFSPCVLAITSRYIIQLQQQQQHKHQQQPVKQRHHPPQPTSLSSKEHQDLHSYPDSYAMVCKHLLCDLDKITSKKERNNLLTFHWKHSTTVPALASPAMASSPKEAGVGDTAAMHPPVSNSNSYVINDHRSCINLIKQKYLQNKQQTNPITTIT